MPEAKAETIKVVRGPNAQGTTFNFRVDENTVVKIGPEKPVSVAAKLATPYCNAGYLTEYVAPKTEKAVK